MPLKPRISHTVKGSAGPFLQLKYKQRRNPPMCGRFTLRSTPVSLADAFGLLEVPDQSNRFNIAPSQAVAVVREKPDGKGRELALLKWGLIPAWADDPAIGNRLV